MVSSYCRFIKKISQIIILKNPQQATLNVLAVSGQGKITSFFIKSQDLKCGILSETLIQRKGCNIQVLKKKQ